MPWNDKCDWGHPEEFSNEEATSAITNADWSQAFYVKISGKDKVTKKVFLYYVFNSYRICLVADVHRKNTASPWNIAGHCYIPGWDGLNLSTPPTVVTAIGTIAEKGDWDELNMTENRYPHPA
ncbi:MAG: hypothetical protein AAFY36_09720 [Bacteroidota bacterium]